MKDSLYTLWYAAGLGCVCAFLLTAASSFTAPYRAANVKAEEFLNILAVLDVPFKRGASSEELVEIFNSNVREKKQGDVTSYVYCPQGQGQAQAVAFGFSGPGLWGPIKGFLALGPDMKTIRGITFYEQEETPGLGGEIGSAWFQGQFEGKSIVDESGRAGIIIGGGGGTKGRNEVDAITGATMTCDKVQEILNGLIKQIVEETESNG